MTEEARDDRPRAVCSRPLRAAPAAQAARHQPSVLSVPCERACGLPAADRAAPAAGALAWQGMVSRARGAHGVPERGVRQGGQHEAGGQTRARAPREGDKGARGATRAVKRSFEFPILLRVCCRSGGAKMPFVFPIRPLQHP